ncbi:hypothetical protein [Sphingobacterium sp. LRF_L2]|uniref:hypothetical protein n=1 Tax=Sphingobacterium sp. LRF_L2 TaxID=3369421 RepID=UPI003F5D986F
MIFFYSIYDHVLGEIEISATLKDDEILRPYTLRIVTPAVRFFWLPLGGGLLKIPILYDSNGIVVKRKRYSESLKQRISEFKRECVIPHFKLWRGSLFVVLTIVIAAGVVGLKNKIDVGNQLEKTAYMVDKLSNIDSGQLYAVSFFCDVDGNSINGLPEGWIRIVGRDADTLFVQRSVKTVPLKPVFDIEHVMPILPKRESDWESTVEKLDYRLMKPKLKSSLASRGVDVLYVEADRGKYQGVVLSINAAL